MADAIEDQLKVQNWLGIVTFDVYKYLKAGGSAIVEETEQGLQITLPGVDINSDGVNKKFRKVAADLVGQNNVSVV